VEVCAAVHKICGSRVRGLMIPTTRVRIYFPVLKWPQSLYVWPALAATSPRTWRGKARESWGDGGTDQGPRVISVIRKTWRKMDRACL
jgi:hypothetical protein